MAFPRKEKQVSDFVAARKIDEEISFVRNDHEVNGTIFKILENSVIVQISIEGCRTYWCRFKSDSCFT